VEDDLGRGYIYDLGKSVGLDSTSTIHKELMEKAKPIFSQHTKPFKIYISPDTSINAFALPGGYLVFNKGLLTKAKKWEEVLGVAAHEMAHVTLKHHSRGLVSQLGWVSLLSLFLGDAGAMTQLIMGTAGQLAQLNYSRDFESEADEKGFEYLTKANIDPQGMVDFFKILEEQYGSKQSVPQFMSTHPDTKNRIAAIQAKVNAYTSKSHVKFSEYESFKFKADSLVIKTL
jgi:predicted Zn-dependent protease